MNIYEIVAKGIENTRRLNGKNKQEFADFLGVPHRTYNYWVRGGEKGPRPSLESIQRIMDKTGQPIGNFFPGSISPEQAMLRMCRFFRVSINEKKPLEKSNQSKRVDNIISGVINLGEDSKVLDQLESFLNQARKERVTEKILNLNSSSDILEKIESSLDDKESDV